MAAMNGSGGWDDKDPEIISVPELRRGVGVLATLLPVLTAGAYAVLAGRGGVLGSISESYYTFTRDVFVGTLCAVAFFLYAYRGYNTFENRFFNVLCGLCLLIALFSMNPTAVLPSPLGEPPDCHQAIAMDPTCSVVINTRLATYHLEWFGCVHLISAATLFASLGYASFFFFTKREANPTARKLKRNIIYRACGLTIWVALALYVLFLAVQKIAPDAPSVRTLSAWPLLLLVETACLWAFGAAWLVKAEVFPGLSDPPEKSTP
jgi:hypothetical protein